MPPKKPGKAKKASTSNENDDDKGEGKPTEREMMMRKQLETLTDDLTEMKQKVDELRKENEWLQEEAQQTRLESHEYMGYMSKKTQKRQTAIVSLNDNNQKELDAIKQQKEEIIALFEQQKNALKEKMLDKETRLAAAKKELAEMGQYQQLQKQQEDEITALEEEVQQMRVKHSETIQKLKAQFLHEKKQFQGESDCRIQAMAKQASQEAKQSIVSETGRIKEENKALRKQLLGLIHKTRALHVKRQELEEQHKSLKRDLQYSKDLRRIQGTRQNRLYKSFGIANEPQQ